VEPIPPLGALARTKSHTLPRRITLQICSRPRACALARVPEGIALARRPSGWSRASGPGAVTVDYMDTNTIDISTETPASAAEAPLTFDQLGLRPQVLDAVRDAGYTEPTPIQREAIPLALSGRDMIGLAHTGTGKTAAFTLPIIDRMLDGPKRTRVLILTPTRELAAQVDDSFRKYGNQTFAGSLGSHSISRWSER